jgi:hypothetical protein
VECTVSIQGDLHRSDPLLPRRRSWTRTNALPRTPVGSTAWSNRLHIDNVVRGLPIGSWQTHHSEKLLPLCSLLLNPLASPGSFQLLLSGNAHGHACHPAYNFSLGGVVKSSNILLGRVMMGNYD